MQDVYNNISGWSVSFHYASREEAAEMLERLRALGVSNDCEGHIEEDAGGGFVAVDDLTGDIISTSARVLLDSAQDEAEAYEEQEMKKYDLEEGDDDAPLATVYALMPVSSIYSEHCRQEEADGEADGDQPSLLDYLEPNLVGAIARGETTIREAYHMQYGHYFAEEGEEDDGQV